MADGLECLLSAEKYSVNEIADWCKMLCTCRLKNIFVYGVIKTTPIDLYNGQMIWAIVC